MTVLNSTNALFWGLKSYQATNSLQIKAWENVTQGRCSGVVLGGEIEATITQGIRGRAEDIVQKVDVPIVQIKRGGETTLHTQGQLVIYPVLNIRELKMGVRDFVATLLKISEKTFRVFGLSTSASENPVGLFTEFGKIGFCGLQIKNGVSQHGLALNICNNLNEFNSIVSCGMTKARFDKLENYVPSVTPEQFFNRWIELACLEGILQKNQNPDQDLLSMDFDFLKVSPTASLALDQ